MSLVAKINGNEVRKNTRQCKVPVVSWRKLILPESGGVGPIVVIVPPCMHLHTGFEPSTSQTAVTRCWLANINGALTSLKGYLDLNSKYSNKGVNGLFPRNVLALSIFRLVVLMVRQLPYQKKKKSCHSTFKRKLILLLMVLIKLTIY